MSWPVPERRAKLLDLYCAGLTFKDIAADYGGTPQGVRSTIRKMMERDDPLAMPRTKRADLADRIRELRALGLYRHEVAERVGVSLSTVERVLKR